jgi:hypothetical protein
VYLTRGKLVIPRSDDDDYYADTWFYFFVKLVDEINQKEIVLAEYRDYKPARRLSWKVAESLGLELKINVRRPEKI